jgi:hypothetical protein
VKISQKIIRLYIFIMAGFDAGPNGAHVVTQVGGAGGGYARQDGLITHLFDVR